MHAFYEILQTIAIVVLCILVLVVGLYLVLVCFDWWLKHKSGSREQEGLSNLLAEAYKGQKPRPDQDNDE